MAADRPWIAFFPPSRGLDRRRPWTWPGTLLGALARLVRSLALLRRFRPDVVLATGARLPRPGDRRPPPWNSLRPPRAERLDGPRQPDPRPPGIPRPPLLPRDPGVPRGRGPSSRGIPSGGRSSTSPRSWGTSSSWSGIPGARALVDAVLRAAPALARAPGLRVRLVVGNAAPPEEVAWALAQVGVQGEVVRYAEPFSEALSRARLVVARPGRRPRPSSPLPAGRRSSSPGTAPPEAPTGERVDVGPGGGALVVPESTAREELGTIVTRLWADGERLRAMAAAARAVARPDAARRAAEALLTLGKENRT